MNGQTLDEKSKQKQCSMCSELRDLALHLHELGLYCEFLGNRCLVYKRKKGALAASGEVFTTTIAKWLHLAAQLDSVNLNAFQYQEAYLYCGPIVDKLESDAAHHENIITPLTRFIFVCNALEECYRLISEKYESIFDADIASGAKSEYFRNYSAQAAQVLRRNEIKLNLPKYYHHFVDNLRKDMKIYIDEFHGNTDVSLSPSSQIDYGLALVRNIRNHIAHGAFPIVENPEYCFNSTEPGMKVILIRLLSRASRIAAMNMQMLIAVAAKGFQSLAYINEADDDEYGAAFVLRCDHRYLSLLHLIQDFGLNESDYYRWHSKLNE